MPNQLFRSRSDRANDPETALESSLEVVLRALLERNCYPLERALSSILSRTPLLGFERMSEAVFQAILDTYVAADPRRPHETTPKYLNHYFSQLGVQITTRPGQTYNAGDLRQSGLGPYGYMDAFLCGLLSLHPKRAVAIELKYISLWSLI